MTVRLRPLALSLVAALAACSRGDASSADGGGAGGRGRSGGATDAADRGATIVSRTKYQVAAVTGGGAVEGRIRVDGTAPGDTTWTVEHDAPRCGTSVTVRPVEGNAGALADAVVWLDDVRSGKPLPETRRVDLTHERCRFAPRVSASAAPTTANFLNNDRAIFLTTITRIGAAKPLASIPFNDDGQVVPSERAGHEAGIVEIRCREHPWATAYLATFDHPYFAVTGADGKFRLDSVPPGKYVLKVWHPRGAQVVSQTVDVSSASSAVELKVPVK